MTDGMKPGQKRGMLKPELQWKGALPPPKPPVAKAAAGGPKGLQAPQRPQAKGLPSNAIPQSQYTLDQLKKMAASRGIPVEKLLAQMVQQYLKEDSSEA